MVRQDERLRRPLLAQIPASPSEAIGIHWPEGFIGNPHATPKCTMTDFSTSNCPVDAQVGVFKIAGLEGEGTSIFVPLYNMETRPDQAGLLGFIAPLLAFPLFFELSGRTDSDYGLDAITTPSLRLPFTHFITELWGVPAEPETRPVPVLQPADRRRRLLRRLRRARDRRLPARRLAAFRQRHLRESDDSGNPLPAEPDHLRRAAGEHRGRRILTAASARHGSILLSARRPAASRRASPRAWSPSRRPARPTRPRGSTPTSRSPRPRARSRRRRRRSRGPRSSLPPGSRQHERRRRQGRLPGSGDRDRHAARRDLPRVLEDRHR